MMRSGNRSDQRRVEFACHRPSTMDGSSNIDFFDVEPFTPIWSQRLHDNKIKFEISWLTDCWPIRALNTVSRTLRCDGVRSAKVVSPLDRSLFVGRGWQRVSLQRVNLSSGKISRSARGRYKRPNRVWEVALNRFHVIPQRDDRLPWPICLPIMLVLALISWIPIFLALRAL